jgi:putative phage-type endonuclease
VVTLLVNLKEHMKTISILPANETAWLEMRSLDITSTEVSVLFDLSPYQTRFELWHRKKEQSIVKIEANDRMKWGTRLQDAIANGVAADNVWHVRPIKEYMRIPELRIGSSFDWRIQATELCNPACTINHVHISDPVDSDDDGILEIKNVDGLAFRDGWVTDEDGNVEAPPHIELQVQHQLLVSGLKFAYIAALVGGNTVALIKRERDEGIINKILEKVADFWNSIDTNEPPSPNFERDAEFITSLYKFAEVNSVYEGTEDAELLALASEYRLQAAVAKEAEAKKQAVKAQILMKIGTSEKVLGEGFSISAGMIGPSEIAYTREGYRNFKINFKKVKTNV